MKEKENKKKLEMSFLAEPTDVNFGGSVQQSKSFVNNSCVRIILSSSL
jgi:hypothetical protein